MKKQEYTDFEWDLILGLDDLAHNRLLTGSIGGKMKKIRNYGRRNKEHKCYCKELGRRKK